ncbi:hypothetical protein PQ478_21530 (plasmid) [Alkalihalophilus pseudofirmus]|uniref:MG2 domain-containing protein n=1 Tax=Alkalihalophilus pseudofirmus TaxID=79885 RepID=UPI00259B6EBD|nr:MG2 domain-containing protein [Alkalihalophilus pseudofirmus]WEG19270.1 hypothetical protein PQ478_21530 [Alkalihalophilus pseudofirmus]
MAQSSIDTLGNGKSIRVDKQNLQARLDVVKTELQSKVSEDTQPIPTESPVDEEAVEGVQSVTSVVTDKLRYLAGETVTITVKVTDDNGRALQGANVDLFITPPRGKGLFVQGKTDQTGTVIAIWSTKRNDAKGTYLVKAVATVADYKSSRANIYIEIR